MAARELAIDIGIARACEVLAVPRASFYRARQDKPSAQPRPSPPRTLNAQEQQEVLDVLRSERFQDKAPAEVYATLLDEGRFLCSIRTMYRLLAQQDEVRERRRIVRHPRYQKPQLLATAPNQVWSWDITKLRGPGKWSFFNLYVILDIFSRYVVGWLVADAESSELARELIEQTAKKQGIEPGQLTLHADRGSSMTSQSVALLVAGLGITKTHSRPHVSDDNPYSESQFKTMKYRPEFPEQFGGMEDARAFCRQFFHWYNCEHRHSGIGLMTPEAVHYGHEHELQQLRREALLVAHAAHPERFVHKVPSPPRLPTAAWINPPPQSEEVGV